MKAASFTYSRPASLAEALALVAEDGPDTRVIAGGQSLVPMMAMRLARPARLVDIGRLDEIRGIECAGSEVRIGAGTTQAEAERSPDIARAVPLLATALPLVGHIQTRNRGTVGGSIAHGDPTAEILLAAVALDARVTLASEGASRCLPVRDCALGPMQTALEDDEILTEVSFPTPPGDLSVGAAVEEVSVRAGDFALLAAAAEVGLDADGVCRHLHLAVGGACPVPVRASPCEEALLGTQPDGRALEEAAHLVAPLLDPEDDVQASARYRRRVAPGLLARALATALDRAADGRNAMEAR